MPGAQLKEVEGDEYRGMVKVKVGPITAQYKGMATVRGPGPGGRPAVLRAEGRDTRGQGNATAPITATLYPTTKGTKVEVATDLDHHRQGRPVRPRRAGRRLRQAPRPVRPQPRVDRARLAPTPRRPSREPVASPTTPRRRTPVLGSPGGRRVDAGSGAAGRGRPGDGAGDGVERAPATGDEAGTVAGTGAAQAEAKAGEPKVKAPPRRRRRRSGRRGAPAGDAGRRIFASRAGARRSRRRGGRSVRSPGGHSRHRPDRGLCSLRRRRR